MARDGTTRESSPPLSVQMSTSDNLFGGIFWSIFINWDYSASGPFTILVL